MDAEETQQLRLRWQQTVLASKGDGELAQEVFDELARRHAELTRFYHTLDHVAAMLQTANRLEETLSAAQVFAVFLHDVIYDSRARDNEERSAEYAHDALKRLGVTRDVREETARLILLTKTHETRREDTAGQVLLDADLSILGAEAAVYDAYAEAIRREYAWVSDDDFRAGRRHVLERFLARPRLYFTDAMFERTEQRARANLARELGRL